LAWEASQAAWDQQSSASSQSSLANHLQSIVTLEPEQMQKDQGKSFLQDEELTPYPWHQAPSEELHVSYDLV
jgi:hypothetical protein